MHRRLVNRGSEVAMLKRMVAAMFITGMTASSFAFADKHVKIDEVPTAARETILRETKGGRITDVEIDEDRPPVYEVEFTREGKKYELDVRADGTIVCGPKPS
jgi:hypothetical protein